MIGETISHYRIIEKLGQGGMGEVYLAEDTRLGRKVALKFLAPDLARDRESLVRFRNEARAAAELSHPNIATVHDIGEFDGKPFLVLEYLEGQTLRERCAQGPLPIEDVLRIGKALAAGLAEAHSHGIVHRDIKSANIMLTDKGEVKILDFGLAHRGDATQLTRPGTTLGTIGYMSPEQARGENADERSDIWSLGVVLYECLTGRLPFTGEAAAVIEQIKTAGATPPTALRTGIPMELEQAVLRCLEKDAQLRYQHADDVLAKIKGTEVHLSATSPASHLDAVESRPNPMKQMSIAATVILAAVLAFVLWPRESADDLERGESEAVVFPWEEHPDLASIAVLPFVDLSPSKDQEYFTDGLSEELLNVLAKVPRLRVAARTSSFQFKGMNTSVEEIGQLLNVAAILEGSVRKAGSQIRITAQLVSVENGFHLWSETYDRTLDDIFAVQDDIASSVVRELKLILLDEEEPSTSRAVNPAAFNLVLKGEYLRARLTREASDEAIGYYEQALEIDPEYAVAWNELAGSYIRQAEFSVVPQAEGYRKAQKAVERALELDPTLALAHVNLSIIHLEHHWAFEAASASMQRALALEPGNAGVLRAAGNLAERLGRFDEAMSLRRRHLQLNPRNFHSYFHLGTTLYSQGKCSEAQAAFETSLELRPNDRFSLSSLIDIHLLKGEPEAALQTFERMDEDLRGFWLWYGARVFWALGRKTEADEALQEYIEDFAEGSAWNIAEVYADRGWAEEAFQWLERAYEQRDSGMTFLLSDPVFGSLHNDSRWRPLLKKVGLPTTPP